MKKRNKTWIIVTGIILSASLIIGRIIKIRDASPVMVCLSLCTEIIPCILACVYAKRFSALNFFRSTVFIMALGNRIPLDWMAGLFRGNLSEIDFMSAFNSEVFIAFRIIIPAGILITAAAVTGIKIGKINTFLLIAAGIMLGAGLLFPKLLFVTAYGFGTLLMIVCVDLEEKISETENVKEYWDAPILCVLYLKALFTLAG